MKIGILGSGSVAQTLAGKLLPRGHEVMISGRDIDSVKETLPSAKVFAETMRDRGFLSSAGSYQNAASFGEMIINATVGIASVDVLGSIPKKDLRGKILIDLANPLDFSKGFPPSVAYCHEESLGEKIQAELPDTRVVKTLNMVNALMMVDPSLAKGDSDIMIAGNDANAKEWVAKNILMNEFGWKNIIDLGDIQAARGMEMYLPLWVRMMGAFNSPHFNIKIVH